MDVKIIEILILLVVGLVIGILGQIIAGGRIGGFLLTIILGWGGAYLGIWVATRFNLPAFPALSVGGVPLVWAVAGSAVLVVIIRLITGKKR